MARAKCSLSLYLSLCRSSAGMHCDRRSRSVIFASFRIERRCELIDDDVREEFDHFSLETMFVANFSILAARLYDTFGPLTFAFLAFDLHSIGRRREKRTFNEPASDPSLRTTGQPRGELFCCAVMVARPST